MLLLLGAPLWLLAILGSSGLLAFKATRRIGAVLAITSTTGVIGAAVAFGGLLLIMTAAPHGQTIGPIAALAMVAALLGALGLGGLAGAVGGGWLAFRVFWPRTRA